MYDGLFESFLEHFLNSWKTSSLEAMSALVSKDYQAREVGTDGKIVDFGYAESITGWEQGFQFAGEHDAQWSIDVISVLPLRDNEMMAVLFATMIIGGTRSDAGNLFFDTFKLNNEQNWQMVRSYVEAGIPATFLDRVQFR